MLQFSRTLLARSNPPPIPRYEYTRESHVAKGVLEQEQPYVELLEKLRLINRGESPEAIFNRVKQRLAPLPDHKNMLTHCQHFNLLLHPSFYQPNPTHLPPTASINLSSFVDIKNKDFNYNTLKPLIHETALILASFTRFNQPDIHIGISGLADSLIWFGLPYDSAEGRARADKVLRFVVEQAKIALSNHIKVGVIPNVQLHTTTDCPIALLADVEPSVMPMRKLVIAPQMRGQILQLCEVHNCLEVKIVGSALDDIARSGSVQNAEKLPQPVKDILKTKAEMPVKAIDDMFALCEQINGLTIKEETPPPIDNSLTLTFMRQIRKQTTIAVPPLVNQEPIKTSALGLAKM